ncbi:MAG: hypothetical protein ACI39W_03780 [Brotaphodocola sp.]
MRKESKHKKRLAGITRYLFHKGVYLSAVLIGIFLCLKISWITADPVKKSLLYDIAVTGKENWTKTFETTAIYQMWDVNSIDSWLLMFLPFFSAYPFVTVFCDDFQSGFVRSAGIRKGSRRYMRQIYLYGIAAIWLSGILALCVFSLICIKCCYSISDVGREEGVLLYRILCDEYYKGYSPPSGKVYVIPVLSRYLRILSAMNIAGIISYLLAAVTKNKYFSLCVPCLLYYFLIKVSDALVAHGIGWGAYITPYITINMPMKSPLLVLAALVCIILLAQELFVHLIGREADYLEC